MKTVSCCEESSALYGCCSFLRNIWNASVRDWGTESPLSGRRGCKSVNFFPHCSLTARLVSIESNEGPSIDLLSTSPKAPLGK